MKCRAVEIGAPVGCVHCGNCDMEREKDFDYDPPERDYDYDEDSGEDE